MCDGTEALCYVARTTELDLVSGFLGGIAYGPMLFLDLCRLTFLTASCFLECCNTNATC